MGLEGLLTPRLLLRMRDMMHLCICLIVCARVCVCVYSIHTHTRWSLLDQKGRGNYAVQVSGQHICKADKGQVLIALGHL